MLQRGHWQLQVEGRAVEKYRPGFDDRAVRYVEVPGPDFPQPVTKAWCRPYITDAARNLEPSSDLQAGQRCLLPPRSIVTFVGDF
jgi:hypothetical protein